MPADIDTVEPVFRALQSVRNAWPGGGWSWDSRLSCVASSFNAELAREAKQAAQLSFSHEYTHKTLGSAPNLVREVAENAGGVRQDQLLMVTGLAGGVFAYGLWWPWGDDVTISFRVGLAGARAPRHEMRFREMFDALE